MHNYNNRGEELLDGDITLPINDPDFIHNNPLARTMIPALKRIDRLHVLIAVFLIALGVTLYVAPIQMVSTGYGSSSGAGSAEGRERAGERVTVSEEFVREGIQNSGS